MFKKNKMKKGFTLIEMMIVVAIIAVLAGVAIPQYNKYVRKSETTEALRFMKQIVDAEILYFSTQKKYKSFDTSAAADKGDEVIGFKAPAEANFKNYKAQACKDTNGDIGLVIKAWTTANDADKTVYMYYPSSMALASTSDKAYYSGASYVQDYVDEATDVSGIVPKCASDSTN